METQSEKNERRFIKLIVGGTLGLVFFITLAVIGVHFFRQWQERHLVRVSAAYLSGGDMKAAMLTARRALQMNSENADAARLIAQIADRAGDKAALDWWRKVVGLQPHNIEDALGLVRSALRANDLATAEKTLASFDDAAKQTAGYHAASGRLAEMKKIPRRRKVIGQKPVRSPRTISATNSSWRLFVWDSTIPRSEKRLNKRLSDCGPIRSNARPPRAL